MEEIKQQISMFASDNLWLVAIFGGFLGGFALLLVHLREDNTNLHFWQIFSILGLGIAGAIAVHIYDKTIDSNEPFATFLTTVIAGFASMTLVEMAQNAKKAKEHARQLKKDMKKLEGNFEKVKGDNTKYLERIQKILNKGK